MDLDIKQTTRTDMENKVDLFEVDSQSTDGAGEQEETFWYNSNFSEYYGYYNTIPELKKAIDTYATWILGKGYEASFEDRAILESITGWGEDTIFSVLWNALVIKKVNGDSFTEIIRNSKTGTLINLKPLDPASMVTVVNGKGIITRYEQISKVKNPNKKFKPEQIFHLSNDRVADNIHGSSVIKSMKWLIDARNEAMVDWRRISHRSTIRVLYIDEDDKTRVANLKSDYAEAINKGELLILPGKPKDAGFQELSLPPVEAFLAWIRYLENAFYKGVGFPKSLTGDAEGITESGGKMAYVNHEPIYNRDVTDLEADIRNQLAIRIKFNKQKSITDEVADTADKNNAQTGFQPNDTIAGRGK